MSTKVVHVNRIGEVTFSRNRRSKNIKISVKHNKSVLVSFPFYVSIQKALDFVSQNEAWIILQQKKFENRKKKVIPGTVVETKLHRVVLAEGEETRVVHSKNEVVITVKHSQMEKAPEMMEHVLTEVYRIEARMILPGRLHEIALMHGFQYNKVSIRDNRRNWGSCSSRNNISLNLQMMKMPDELIDYVLLHELVHTRIKNHSAEFWKEMDRLTNNRAKELAGMVKKYSAYTL